MQDYLARLVDILFYFSLGYPVGITLPLLVCLADISCILFYFHDDHDCTYDTTSLFGRGGLDVSFYGLGMRIGGLRVRIEMDGSYEMDICRAERSICESDFSCQ
jgi:hypothetical protein